MLKKSGKRTTTDDKNKNNKINLISNSKINETKSKNNDKI
jgi:hypothetical protein